VGRSLLRSALQANRPYHIIVPVTLAGAVREEMEVTRSSLARIYRLDPTRFQPVINVLVQRTDTPDSLPRFQIESQGQTMALAGVNWRSPTFAEIFVYVHPRGRGRGWGKSVVSACTAALLNDRVQPLYTVEEGNEASVHIAESLGYVDTGLRQFVGEGSRRGG
jgi:predicted GNAT family acetyltransferase